MSAGVPRGLVDLLRPAGTVSSTRRPGTGGLLVLPSARRPRMLVPADVPGAAVMLRRHSTSRGQRLAQDALARAQRHGALRWLPVARLAAAGEGGLVAHVCATLDEAHRVGVLLGPPRANAKPVLQVFDSAGRTVAFGKVGHTRLAAQLVRHEARVLAELGGLSFVHLEVPPLLHAGSWQGLEIVCMAAMPAAQSRSTSWEPPLAAMRELAESGGSVRSALAASPYAADLRRRAAAVAPDLDALARDVVVAHGGAVLGLGRWHGDWAPWNMARSRDGSTGPSGERVQVWDWERSATGVPLGLDAVHFRAQALLRDRVGPEQLADGLLDGARRDLSCWYGSGDGTRDEVRATVLLYLVEILQRYRGDADGAMTEALRRRTATVRQAAEHLTTHVPEDHRASA